MGDQKDQNETVDNLLDELSDEADAQATVEFGPETLDKIRTLSGEGAPEKKKKEHREEHVLPVPGPNPFDE